MHVYDIPLRRRFRGIERRRGVIARTAVGWLEWSPFPEYSPAEAATWLDAARETIERGWPEAVRELVPVNVTIPATDPATAHRLVVEGGCATAKVKVAEPGQGLADDLARVEAVRAALGPSGRLRVDANGAWDVDQAERALTALDRFDLEYAEQPCATVAELAALRRRLARRDILIAADESIRRSGDPERVVAEAAADIAVLKVQPLGGMWRCLELAERLGLPVVVSSAIETSVGLAQGVALAAALPDLPYACGLNTGRLLAGDVTDQPLVATDGCLRPRRVEPDPALLAATAASPEVERAWRQRLREATAAGGGRRARYPGAAGDGSGNEE